MRAHTFLSAAVLTGCLAGPLHGQARPVKQAGGRALIDDQFWGRPLTFADVFLLRVEEKLNKAYSHWGSNPGPYIPYEDRTPTTNAYIGVDGRAVIATSITGLALKKTPREVCESFFKMSDWELAKSFPLPAQARDNMLSHNLPPSAGLTSRPERLRAYEVLYERTDLRFEYFQVDTKQLHTCTRAVNGTELTIETRTANEWSSPGSVDGQRLGVQAASEAWRS